jgi:uncharacterized protein YjeT (DUF2065 family)
MGTVPAFLGLVFLIVSNIMYFRRTHDIKWFWLAKHLLTAPEYILNRFGFALTVAGLVALLALLIWLRLEYRT